MEKEQIGKKQPPRESKGTVTIRRENGSITLELDYYLKLSDTQRRKLHKAWESA